MIKGRYLIFYSFWNIWLLILITVVLILKFENQDFLKLEDFINSLFGVTSSTVNPLHRHELKSLSDENCWSIIKAKTIGKEGVPSEFEATGRKITRRCHGLPLAANVVGGVLSNKSEEKWLAIVQKWLSHDGDKIRNILRLSFDNLSPPLLDIIPKR